MSPYLEIGVALLFLCLGFWMGRAGLPVPPMTGPGKPAQDDLVFDRLMADEEDTEDIPTL